MMDDTEATLGVKIATLVFSFLGAAVALSYTTEMTRTRAIIAVATGTIVSVAATPLALHYLGLPEGFERAVAFFAGLIAMRAVPAALAVVDRFRNVKLPFLPDDKP